MTHKTSSNQVIKISNIIESMATWNAQLDNLGPAANIQDYKKLLETCPNKKSEIYEWLERFIDNDERFNDSLNDERSLSYKMK